MRTNNTFRVQFITRSNKAKDGLYPIYARISVDGRRVEVSLKKFIHPDNWNDAKGSAKGKSDEIRNFNTYLEQIHSRLTDCYQDLVIQKKMVTAEAVKNLFCGNEEKKYSLIPLFDYHNTEMKTMLEWGTLKNYFTTRRYVAEYLKAKLKTSDVYLSQLNYKFLSDFERFMKSYVPKDQKKPCG